MRTRLGTMALSVVLAVAVLPVLPQPAVAADPDMVGYVEPNGRWHIGGEAFWFGVPGDLPLFGDWDCDGMDSPGVFRPSTGQIHLTNETATGTAVRSFWFGQPGDVPFVGDWSDLRCDRIGVYRPSDRTTYVRNTLDTGVADGQTRFPGAPEAGTPFVDHPTNRLWWENLRFFENGRIWGPSGSQPVFYFGQTGDLIMTGDWNGNGVITVGVLRPSDGKAYLRYWNSTAAADAVIDLGANGVPIAGSLTSIEPGWTRVGERFSGQ